MESIWREWSDYSKQGKRECVGMNVETENSQMKGMCGWNGLRRCDSEAQNES